MKFISLLLATALSFCAVAAPSLAGSHEDKRLGYKIYTPKKWTSIPISSDESWVVAKFLSPRFNYYTDKNLGYTFEHKPQMEVIAFLSDKYKEDEIVTETDEDGNVEKIIFKLTNPYKNYSEYLKGTYSGGGFYIAEEKEETVGDYLVTKYVIKVEKQSYGPKRIVTWVYHTADIDFAVQVECFESAYSKLKKDIKKIHSSFEEIPRTEGTVARTGVTGASMTFDAKKKTPKERMKSRKDTEKTAAKAAKGSLTDGWSFVEIDPFMFVHHDNAKQAKMWADRGKAVYKFCEKSFPDIGKDEHVSKMLVRICKDYDEARAFSPYIWTSSRPLEFVLYRDNVGVGSMQNQLFNYRVMQHWLRQKDRDLYFDLPPWMRNGLQSMISNAKIKGKKLELRASDWENMGLREEVKAGTAHTPKEIFLSNSDNFQDENFSYEAAALMRFLLAGPGSKNRLTKNIIKDYFANLKEVSLSLAEEDDDDEPRGEAETEEEEEARYKARQALGKENEQRIVEATFEATFGSWDDKDWLQFEKLYFKAIQ
jgi:hypothetical protein